jgi:hypothetical protein
MPARRAGNLCGALVPVVGCVVRQRPHGGSLAELQPALAASAGLSGLAGRSLGENTVIEAHGPAKRDGGSIAVDDCQLGSPPAGAKSNSN